MDTFLLIIVFFLGLLLIFAIGSLIGHIFKLDQMLGKEKRRRAHRHFL